MIRGLSIIIVNHKSVNLIIDCLHSFVPEISMQHWEVIIVDNFSNDNSENLINKVFPFVKYIQMGYNAGFSRANNKGILSSAYDTILLLNADTIIEKNALAQCYQQLTQSNYVGCGVQLLNIDRSYQVSGSRVMKGGLNYLLLLPYLRSLFSLIAKLIKVKKPSIDQVSALQEVDWINGAFIMVKREATLHAGLLDEDFFLYMEEIEWCSRLRKQGKLCLFGQIEIIHLQGITTKELFQSKNKGYQHLFDKMGRQIMLSIWVRQRKEFGLGWFLFLLLAYGIEIPIFLLALCISKLFFLKKYTFTDFAGFTKNYFYNTQFIVPLIQNKPCFYKAV